MGIHVSLYENKIYTHTHIYMWEIHNALQKSHIAFSHIYFLLDMHTRLWKSTILSYQPEMPDYKLRQP